MQRRLNNRYAASGLGVAGFTAAVLWLVTNLAPVTGQSGAGGSKSIFFRAPAGTLPASRHINVDGVDAAVLPNGRLLTPVGLEVSVNAPKPYGMALSPDGTMLATINSGASRFSISLVRNLGSSTPTVTRINVSSTFMGISFSADGSRFFASGGENGVLWVGDTAGNRIIGSINLNGPTHAINAPWTVTSNPTPR